MAAMCPMMPMMLTMPYQATNHMGQQFNPPTSAVAPPAPAPATPAGMMMHLGGPVAKVPFFQMVQISLLSVLIYSTRCEYDILIVFKK
jgi:hypothetical protein